MDNEDTSTGEAAPAVPRRKKLMVPGIIAVAMIVEGAGIFGAMKMFGSGPGSAAAVDSIQGLEEADSKGVEVHAGLPRLRPTRRMVDDVIGDRPSVDGQLHTTPHARTTPLQELQLIHGSHLSSSSVVRQ